jgi:hypothetical protein
MRVTRDWRNQAQQQVKALPSLVARDVTTSSSSESSTENSWQAFISKHASGSEQHSTSTTLLAGFLNKPAFFFLPLSFYKHAHAVKQTL